MAHSRPIDWGRHRWLVAAVVAFDAVSVMAAAPSAIAAAPGGGVIVAFAGDPSGIGGNAGDGLPATSANLYSPLGIAVDSAGNVYIADQDARRVRKVDRGGTITNFAGSPTGLEGDTGDGGPSTSATLGNPFGVAVDSAGNVYISDIKFDRVRKVDTRGIITTFAGGGHPSNGYGDGGPAIAAALSYPRGIAVDSGGDVYIADSGNYEVRKVDAGGIITDFAGNPKQAFGNAGDGGPATSATLGAPVAVAVDVAGNVYIADLFYERVRKVDAGGTITNFAGSATGVAGGGGDGGPATSATFTEPWGVAVDAAANLYISSYPNHRVREVLAPVAPSITSAANGTFTVGAIGSLTVRTAGVPSPTVTETGPLPSGVTFNNVTQTLSGTPMPATAGSYPITFTAANGVGTAATQYFTLVVDQATMTYPTDGQANVDTTQPFRWSTIPEAQNYYLAVGTAAAGYDLVNSGVLPPTQSSLTVPALPVGIALHATLLAKVNGGWTSYQAITFTAAPVQVGFTFPLNGQTSVDPTRPFAWSTVAPAESYYLIVGTRQYGYDLVNSGPLPPTQSSYATPVLPTGTTLYASVLTKFGGAWSQIQSVTFMAGPAMGTLTVPVDGQLNVATPGVFAWSTITGAQNYYLVVGTTAYGFDLVNSGVLAPSLSSFTVPALPHGTVLYATMLTKVKGTWAAQAARFTAA